MRLEAVLGPLQEEVLQVDPEQESTDPDAGMEEGELEGGDQEQSSGLGEYPIDSIMIRTETRTVHDVVRRMDQGQVILDPDFQRDFVWRPKVQSRLIESALMRIPLPVMYFAENTDGKVVVVDGRQRLTTFRRFVKGELPLDLETPQLRGKRFKDLDVKLQNRIEDTNLVLYLIDSKVSDKVRFGIFERVNGGVPLTRQQMRNCIYTGPATQLLRDCAREPVFAGLFAKNTQVSMSKSMRDREIVNRFFAFRLRGWQGYGGDMDSYLGETLTLINGRGEDERQRLLEAFRWGVVNNITLFGRHAFRRHEQGAAGRTPQFNVALWDAWATALSFSEIQENSEQANRLRASFYGLLREESFQSSITLGTNQSDKVIFRLSSVVKAVEEARA